MVPKDAYNAENVFDVNCFPLFVIITSGVLYGFIQSSSTPSAACRVVILVTRIDLGSFV